MKQNPAHNSTERIAIAGYYDAKTQSSDKELGKCTNKEALDHWVLDNPVHCAWPNGGVPQDQTGHGEGHALVGLPNQSPRAGGYAGSHWSVRHRPTYLHQQWTSTYHQPDDLAKSPAIYTSGSTPAEEPIQDLVGHLEWDPALGRRRHHPHVAPNHGVSQLQSAARQVGGYSGSHHPTRHPLVCVHQHVAPTYHLPGSFIRPPTICTHRCLASEEPIQGDSWAGEAALGMISSACLVCPIDLRIWS